MATNTYVALDKVTLGSATNTVNFTSIPQTATDLVLVIGSSLSTGGGNPRLQLNSNTGTNYSQTSLFGNGTSASSFRISNSNHIYFGGGSGTANTQSTTLIHLMNYSNTTTNKTVLIRYNDVTEAAYATVGMFRNTAAITSIQLTTQAGNFNAGSTFSLYGIKSASVGAKATGGTIYSDDTYYYHVFGSTGTFTPLQSLSADVLVVAGGGGGASRWGGGGGAGGYRTGTGLSVTAQAYTITVGAGGAGGASAAYNKGTSGTNSTFSSITSSGGGGGGTGGTGNAPLTGGSGGGGGQYNQNGAAGNAGSYSPVEGYAGGNTAALAYQGAGGGGAGGAGSNATTQQLGGAGGIGSNSVSTWATATGTGVSGYYAGGGGGGGETANGGISGGAGGLGGGGRGGNQNGAGVAATINTGGGGGGGGNDANAGAAGGSGIVIIRYAK